MVIAHLNTHILEIGLDQNIGWINLANDVDMI